MKVRECASIVSGDNCMRRDESGHFQEKTINLRGVIFDFDGVLVDSHPSHKEAWKMFLASMGKSVSDHALGLILEGQKRDDLLQHFLGPLTAEQVREYGRRKDIVFDTLGKDIRPVGGVLEFIAGLDKANIPLAIGSSAHRSRVEHTLQKLRLKRRFNVIVTGDDVAQGKPDPAIFCLAANAWGVPPDCMLVCEDSVNGAIAAKRAGMKCLCIGDKKRESALRSAGVDKVVPDFTATSIADVIALKL